MLARAPHGELGPLLRSLNVLDRANRRLKAFFSVVPCFRRGSYDVIHAHFGTIGARAAHLREIGALRGKLVTSFHGFDMSKTIRLSGAAAYARLFGAGDLFAPVSDCWKARLLELGCPRDKVVVHRMGIDRARFPFSARRPEPGRPLVLLSVARLVEKKGLEFAIRAFAQVRSLLPGVRYHIVGDGPLRLSLERLAAELNVSDAVSFLGPREQNEIIACLRNAHIFLAPSVTGADGDQEGIPVVLMEAMSTGLPVVSTRHSGIPELVEDGASGYLVPERDVEALAQRLRLLAEHPERWPAMGWAGHSRVAEAFDLDRLNDRLVALYGTVARQRPDTEGPRR